MVIETSAEDSARILIVGLGATGLSCARFLHQQGFQVAVADSREQPPGLEQLRQELPDVAMFLGEFDEAVFTSASQLVMSPGVPISLPQVQAAISAGVEITGDIDLFSEQALAPVVAITGSNAKSTVTTLFGLMAKAGGLNVAVGGNLGEPALNLLDENVELYVLELSSFQLETSRFLHPAVATVLNISADHMDRYEDLEAYSNTKARILDAAVAAVYNLDDPRVMAMPETPESRYFTIESSDDPRVFCRRQIDGSIWLCQGKLPLIDTAEMNISGAHNHANALAALAIGSLLGLKMEKLLSVLRTFGGLPHRSEFVTEHNEVRWYNDSKGTNPGATIAALRGLHQDDHSRTVLIAGGDCKQADFSELGVVIGECVSTLVLLGRDREEIRAVTPSKIKVLDAASMSEAVQLAAKAASSGDRVLLSPCCASFDMYKNFEQRGDDFSALVRELAR